jgi:plasmid stability protein
MAASQAAIKSSKAAKVTSFRDSAILAVVLTRSENSGAESHSHERPLQRELPIAEKVVKDSLTTSRHCAISDSTKFMPQLIVRRIEDKVVRKLKARAGLHGVSTEEEHRRILREALLGKSAKRPSFKDYLLGMPDVGADSAFDRTRDAGRKVAL